MREFPINYRRTILALIALLCFLLSGTGSAQDPTIIRNGVWPLYHEGEYEDVEEICSRLQSRYRGSMETVIAAVKSRALTDLGRTREAWTEANALAERRPDDVVALVIAHNLAKVLGEKAEADRLLKELNKVAARKTTSRTPAEWVSLGKAAVLLGAEPDVVFKSYFDRAKQLDPRYPDSWVAAGQLALSKYDYTRAAKEFTDGAGQFPRNLDFLLGLARANASSDEGKSREFLAKLLELNGRHPEALVMMARFHLDADEHDECEAAIRTALRTCPDHPEAWAVYAALAHYRNEEGELEARRDKALERNARNPLVDHRIGEALARKRRFKEGAEHQRTALAFDPSYVPAKLELAMDLLRLGDEPEAWKIVAEIREEDPYSVLAYNLTLLRKKLESFVTLTRDGFTLKMAPGEAEVYGNRALDVLSDAHDRLAARYGYEHDGPVLVEFFSRQQDFAVRTLGVPGGGGLLGACFGSVVTMNSPGGVAAGINNWESTLYHEYCHVVTLGASKNRMPRWLSEGISVYEEVKRNPAWGQKMTPSYRRRILDDDGLDTIANMSRPFMKPEDGADLMFGYYEASLAIEYLVQEGGEESLRNVLADLAEGIPILESFEKRIGKLKDLEKGFAKYGEAKAKSLPAAVDWSVPEMDRTTPAQVLKDSPTNYIALSARARELAGDQDWEALRALALKMTGLWPEDGGEGSPWLLLAEAERRLENPEAEADALRKLARISSEALPAYRRLLEIEAERSDWGAVLDNAQKHMAVNPMIAAVHGKHGEALEATGEPEQALAAYQRWLALGPASPSRAHFRIARLLADAEPVAAKRHLLDALADAPRYREAHRLLREMTAPKAEPVDPVELVEPAE